MTGPDRFGQYPDPRQPQWGPPPQGQWGTGGPAWTPSPPPRRSRRPLIIGAVAAAVIAITGTAVAVTQRSSNGSPSGSSVAATPTSAGATTTARRPFFMVADPDDLLPTADEVKGVTLLDVKPTGNKPMSVSQPDHLTDPPSCALAASATTKSMWGDVTQLSGQQYTDQGTNTAWAGLAFWDSDTQANASLAKLTTAIQGCTHFVMRGDHGDPDTQWTTTDIRVGDQRISWTSTPHGNDPNATPWKCAKDYQVKANLAVTAMLCAANPGQSAAALSDLLLSKATKGK